MSPRDPASSAWIGLDLGSTNVKAAAFEADAGDPQEDRCLYSCSRRAPLSMREGGIAEQQAAEVLDGARAVLGETAAALRERGVEIAGVCLSGAMHSVLGVDGRGEPITPLMTWADSRGAEQATRLRAGDAAGEIYQRTGTPIHPMSPFVKLLWFAEQHPELLLRVKRWVSSKSYVLFHLTGEWVEDHGIASASGLLDCERRTWERSALAAIPLSPEQLPALVDGTTALGLLPERAADLGVAPGTPIFAGGSDGAMANIGMGVVSEEALALSLGTSGALRTTLARPVLDPAGRLFCYAMDGERYIAGGPVSNGGLVLAWVVEKLLGGHLREEELLTRVADVSAASDGLFCLPYLTGERAPQWRPDLAGSFHGIRAHHDYRHLARAAIEGVAFQLRWILSLLEGGDGAAPRWPELQVSGGVTVSPVWRQILADILGRNLVIHEEGDQACLGAVRLVQRAVLGRPYPVAGAAAAGSARRKWVVEAGKNRGIYDAPYARFRQLADARDPG